MSPAEAELVEAIARRVVELLRAEGAEAVRPRYVDAGTLAEELKVERDWVYAHAHQLGAIRLGGGPRGRLRFDRELVAERLGGEEAGAWRPPRRKPRRARSGEAASRRKAVPGSRAERVDSKKSRRRAGGRTPAAPPKRQHAGGTPE